jgi:hypothetical protein
MKVKVNLMVQGKTVLEETIEIEDIKLEPLEETEIEDAVQIKVSSWANEQISIAWETEQD